MKEPGESVRSEGRIYFTGGVSAVLMGWREMTLDVNLKADPEPLGCFESLPELKESLKINIEPASPDLFVPALPCWQDRSPLIDRYGKISFFHYDFYGQALAKIERDHPRDREDVASMFRGGLIRDGLIRDGFADLCAGRETIASCLVCIASLNLRAGGFSVGVSDEVAWAANHRLYEILDNTPGKDAGRHNALSRELVSFERALSHRCSQVVSEGLPGSGSLIPSREDAVDDVPMHIGEAAIGSVVVVGELLVIKP